MPSWAIVVPCGRTEQEIERVTDVLDGLFHYEPDTRWVVVVDSCDEDRRLADRFDAPAGTTLVSVRNPTVGRAKGVWGGLCAGMLLAFRWVARNTDAEFVVKLDSDALVIDSFAEPIRRALADHPTAGAFGAYLRDPNGVSRGYEGMAALVRRLHRLALLEYEPKRFGRRFPLAIWGRPAAMRRHIDDAVRNGYPYGQHVSGGAYAVRRAMLDRMRDLGYLNDPTVWADTEMSEDVMVGMYAWACGFGLAGLAADGEVFGVKHVGLPDTPERLVGRGFRIIHSVKNDPRATEEEIREYFRARRSSAVPA